MLCYGTMERRIADGVCKLLLLAAINIIPSNISQQGGVVVCKSNYSSMYTIVYIARVIEVAVLISAMPQFARERTYRNLHII